MKPNLIIIGSMKCGTTSLHYYLNLHPDVSMSNPKELDFFVDRLNWEKGTDWYTSHFTGLEKIHGESSPSYTMYPNFSGVPERMHSLVPDAKLIYIVRDPIDRVVSHYLEHWYEKRHNDDLLQILSDPDSGRSQGYILTSSYYLQLSQYLEYYDQSKILIVSLEEMTASREETLRKVFRFLDIDDTFSSPEYSNIANESDKKVRTNSFGKLLFLNNQVMRPLRKISKRVLPTSAVKKLLSLMGTKQPRPELNPELRKMLQDYLNEDMSKFRELTGESFEKWSV